MNDSLQEEARAREAAANKLHQELEAKRAVYDEKVAAELEKQKEIQAEAERVEAEMRAKRNEEFQERLERFREYEAAKKVLQEEEERMKKQQEEEEARNRAERMLVNGGRVKYRQQETKERMEERKRQEESLNELKRQKALALERFFASVDEKIGVESDPSRILQGTVSSEQRPAETANTSPSLHGYTDDQVMKDPRARLFHALLEVGLHQGPYAREVMSRGYRVSPAQQTSDTNPFRGDF
ncbi:hypothetical protein AGDE_08608 [Angomonas deanei]|uniref:Uncharacterized protein n=1 Tax=Angomonas deanei TaxID=59799 RepID=A0A7G2CSQ0_9TRYP|nr:hypothetical protein AGDE_08608 [Angomonas deanei]CAD2222585.1 hypothetical protein, conserved [Angomonas deanei]|eukprot:EPY32525.1 hypothetical protein AGDE_08608 [Angomonas deanei]